MKLSKVKVGMRVKWWNFHTIKFVSTSVVKIMDNDGYIKLGNGFTVHCSCLTALKPRRVAREFWANGYSYGGIGYMYYTKEAADRGAGGSRTECIRVREVLEKK